MLHVRPMVNADVTFCLLALDGGLLQVERLVGLIAGDLLDARRLNQPKCCVVPAP